MARVARVSHDEDVSRTQYGRKVAPKVREGVVQKKHRHHATAALGFVVDRESPDEGCQHVVTKRDIHDLTSIIPHWSQLRVGLEGVILASGDAGADGRYCYHANEHTGSIEIPAWTGDLWTVFTPDYFEEHREILERLAVASGPIAAPSKADGVECRFTLPQAKAFVLLHVFLHELGHHVDRMHSKQQRGSPRGEPFAEHYANSLASLIWSDYVRLFGDPRRAR